MNKRITKKKRKLVSTIILVPIPTWTKHVPKWKRRKLIQRSYERYGISVGFHTCPHTLEDRNIRGGRYEYTN